MSRVKKPNKFLNLPKRDSSHNCSKVVRIHSDKEDYTKATTLSSWLFLKYNMSYASFSRKSKTRKDALRKEYQTDTKKEFSK